MTERVLPAGFSRLEVPFVESPWKLIGGQGSDGCIYHRSKKQGKQPVDRVVLAVGRGLELSWEDYRRDPELGQRMLADLLERVSSTVLPMAGYLAYEAGYLFEPRWQNLHVPETGYAVRMFEVLAWYEADWSGRTGSLYYHQDIGLPIAQHTFQQMLKQATRVAEEPSPSARAKPLHDFTETEFCERVRDILEDINAGRYYELNFTQRFVLESSIPPDAIWHTGLQALQPDHAFYLIAGDEAVCSFSPELYLDKTTNRILTRPIKGSMAQADGIPDEKLLAEHVMVVDLARNDLGRISGAHDVHVDRLCAVEGFGGLAHIVSDVSAETEASLSQVLQATFPAASITGVPKVEVVQAISANEKSPRGVYTGTCGWIWPGGDCELNVAIRTMVAVPRESGWTYTLAAGGAIVADSVAEDEYREGLMKVAPLLKLLKGCE